MSKVHISAGPTPLPSSSAPIPALCGTLVVNPYPEMMTEVGSRGLPERKMGDCAKCWTLAEHLEVPRGERLFVYWVRSIPEVMAEFV